MKWTVYASLMAAMTAVGAYIHIPIGPVPIVLQNLFVLLAGLVLGSRWALISMGIYLIVGAAGIPVFAGGKGGIAHFFGPTGGYLLGFALAAFTSGWIAEHSKGRLSMEVVAVITGSLCIYALGIPWLKMVTGMSWTKTFLAGMIPFIPGDAIKAATALALARAVRPVLNRQMEPVA
jgi:biotin transport system substrate-specific component